MLQYEISQEYFKCSSNYITYCSLFYLKKMIFSSRDDIMESFMEGVVLNLVVFGGMWRIWEE